MMVSKFALLFSCVIASAALAAPSSQPESHLASRGANHLINRVDAPAAAPPGLKPEDSSNWSGAILTEHAGTFTAVTGTFTVPTFTGSEGGMSTWVGIDGYTCKSAILQTGVDFWIFNGKVFTEAWYVWYPGNPHFFNITINSGDKIQVTVTASSPNSGAAVMENLTTGQVVAANVSSSSSLCRENADWVFADYEGSSNLTIEFTGAAAYGSSGRSYTPAGASILRSHKNDEVFPLVTTGKDTVSITYV